MTSLQLKDVSVIFDSASTDGKTEALSNINLEVKGEEFVVVLGASGCGKTTLLNLLAGFLTPTSGAASLVNGDGDSHEITRPGAERGVVFQKHALLPWLNVIDNVAFGLKLSGIGRSERYATSDRFLDLTSLTKFREHKIYQLSGGMQQRVGIARALACDPEILLMDEPLGALDALTREILQELLIKIWAETRKIVFFITHSVEEALFLATRLIIMSPRPGRITHEFNLDFCRRYLKGEDARSVKSLPEFIEVRERVLGIIHGDEPPEEGTE